MSVDFYMPDVRRGVTWLDSVKPEWRTLIDVNRLDVGESDRCVLGQVFKAEAAAHGEANGYCYVDHRIPDAQDHMLDRGFCARSRTSWHSDFDDLTQAWRLYLTEAR